MIKKNNMLFSLSNSKIAEPNGAWHWEIFRKFHLHSHLMAIIILCCCCCFFLRFVSVVGLKMMKVKYAIREQSTINAD